MYCAKCGNTLKDDANFCAKCGEMTKTNQIKVESSKVAETNQGSNVVQSSTKVLEEAVIQPTTTPQMKEVKVKEFNTQPPEIKKKKGCLGKLLIGVGLVFVVFVVLIGLLLFMPSGDPVDDDLLVTNDLDELDFYNMTYIPVLESDEALTEAHLPYIIRGLSDMYLECMAYSERLFEIGYMEQLSYEEWLDEVDRTERMWVELKHYSLTFEALLTEYEIEQDYVSVGSSPIDFGNLTTIESHASFQKDLILALDKEAKAQGIDNIKYIAYKLGKTADFASVALETAKSSAEADSRNFADKMMDIAQRGKRLLMAAGKVATITIKVAGAVVTGGVTGVDAVVSGVDLGLGVVEDGIMIFYGEDEASKNKILINIQDTRAYTSKAAGVTGLLTFSAGGITAKGVEGMSGLLNFVGIGEMVIGAKDGQFVGIDFMKGGEVVANYLEKDDEEQAVAYVLSEDEYKKVKSDGSWDSLSPNKQKAYFRKKEVERQKTAKAFEKEIDATNKEAEKMVKYLEALKKADEESDRKYQELKARKDIERRQQELAEQIEEQRQQTAAIMEAMYGDEAILKILQDHYDDEIAAQLADNSTITDADFDDDKQGTDTGEDAASDRTTVDDSNTTDDSPETVFDLSGNYDALNEELYGTYSGVLTITELTEAHSNLGYGDLVGDTSMDLITIGKGQGSISVNGNPIEIKTLNVNGNHIDIVGDYYLNEKVFYTTSSINVSEGKLTGELRFYEGTTLILVASINYIQEVAIEEDTTQDITAGSFVGVWDVEIQFGVDDIDWAKLEALSGESIPVDERYGEESYITVELVLSSSGQLVMFDVPDASIATDKGHIRLVVPDEDFVVYILEGTLDESGQWIQGTAKLMSGGQDVANGSMLAELE